MVLNRLMVIDGGFATQLTVHVGHSVDGDPLWSARFNSTNPSAIVKTHLDFLQAGADAIITNTYQASVEGFMEHLDLDEEQSVELIKSTVRLAQLARNKFLAETTQVLKEVPWILGSIGPYGAHLHDGSEYTGEYADTVDVEVIKKWHRVRIEAVLEAGVDGLAIETIPCRVEAQALVDIMTDEYPDVKYWLAFQCKDDQTIAHGENFAETCREIWAKAKDCSNILAIGTNCVNPRIVTPLFKSLNGGYPEVEKIPLVVYPNSGEVYTVKDGWTGKEDCQPLENYAGEWISLGAKIIGGCCRTYARDIQRIKKFVQNL
uniref:Putative cysteine s-methyltransferase n=1 Tax=Nyssomyia neivai TaxID=330878 RepID=A0A1L8E2J7_9DIPT